MGIQRSLTQAELRVQLQDALACHRGHLHGTFPLPEVDEEMDAAETLKKWWRGKRTTQITRIEASGLYTNYPDDCISHLMFQNLVCELFKIGNIGWWRETGGWAPSGTLPRPVQLQYQTCELVAQRETLPPGPWEGACGSQTQVF